MAVLFHGTYGYHFSPLYVFFGVEQTQNVTKEREVTSHNGTLAGESCLVLVLVASLQWISQQRCVRPATKGNTYTAGF